MRICDDPNVDTLRQKARVLEDENERLIEKVSELLREVWTLKGMAAEPMELNLPGLKAQAAGKPDAPLTSAGSERRPRDGENKEKKPKTGHGPTKQPKLELVETTYPVADDAREECGVCGLALEDWNQSDNVEVVRRTPPSWYIEKCTLEKCRCKNGCTIVTAKGPAKLIDGGRYAFDVAVSSAVEKFLDHIPLERQVRIARRLGMRITSQTLWDQQEALATLLKPLVKRIKAHVISRPVIGTDLSPFKLIQKGGSLKWQVWQLACPDARYFEILGSKEASVGRGLFEIVNDDGDVTQRFSGTAVADGAAELEKVSADVGFTIANCWSHARRKALEAKGEAPGQVAELLELIGKLYALERALEPEPRGHPGGYRRRIDVERLREVRDKDSRKVIAEIKAWIGEQKCVPGGLLKKKLMYIATRFTALSRFLDDPLIPLDNNQTEGGFVGLAQGRRNYVGCRSERGTKVAAIFYTVFESCRVVDVDGQAYLMHATSELLEGRSPHLPHEWAAASLGTPPPVVGS